MAQSRKVGPGPVGTSCLTCKRRHKKCDLRRPVCEKCEMGGLECLGYSHNNRSSLVPPGLSRPRLILPKQQTANILPTRQAISSSACSEMDSLGRSAQVTLPPWENENNAPSASSPLCLGDLFINTIEHLDRVNDTLTTQKDELLAAHPPPKRGLGPTPSLRSLFKFYTQVPCVPSHLSKTFLDSGNLEDYVMSHCDRTMERTFFKPVRAQLTLLRNSFASRLRGSGFTRWIVFLSARVCEAYSIGDTSQNKTYGLSLCQMEQALRSRLTGNLPPNETQDRLGNWLEVTLLKAMVLQGSNAFLVLRTATPTFLQMLFSEPDLWPRSGDLTSVPLANVLASRRHELSYFALVDITAAMTFGIPQQIKYNTSLACPPNGSVPHEWMHCSPIEFQVTLAEINACRDKSLNARDWQEIEHKLLTWQARPNGYDANLESWMKVAWFAVQESWRHTLLAYLYMAVCGASSDDPRIQSSVRQIFSVIGTVKRQESSNVNAPFFIQCLMAGICARSEKHRSLARQQLVDASYATPQLVRAIDFIPVLDHLWHGVAAGGRPVVWSDYVCSRETVLPVLM